MNAFDPRLPLIAAAARVKTCHVHHCWHAMREMGKQFHRAAFATFAGLEVHHVDAIMHALDEHDALPERRQVTERRATRLPDDWVIPTEWVEFASRERRWQPHDAKAEAESFANYWQAKSGKDATKLDWEKTWRNWVRNSRRPDGDYAPVEKYVASAEQMERTAALYERMGRTTEAEEIRRRIPRDNVVQLHLNPHENGEKRAFL